jgi:hypothetical protein
MMHIPLCYNRPSLLRVSTPVTASNGGSFDVASMLV